MQLDGIAAKAATVLQAHSQILLICLISLQLSHYNQSRTRHGSATVTPSPATTETGRGYPQAVLGGDASGANVGT